MMQIVVCMKQIAHTYARTGFDPERHFLALEDSIYCLNRHDEAALELALRVKDTQSDTRVVLLTIGPLLAENELRRCLALGADRLCRIDLERELDSWSKARVLATVIKELGADLIFCGKESLDRGNGQVGAFLAWELGLPLVSAVSGLTTSSDGTGLQIERNAGRGTREILACPGPALLTVAWGSVAPRLPSYPDKIKAWSRPIEVLAWKGGEPTLRLRRRRILPPRPRTKNIPAPDSRLGAAERIRQLLAGSRVEKKGRILTGDPQSQVEEIVSFLKEHDFLARENGTKDERENQ